MIDTVESDIYAGDLRTRLRDLHSLCAELLNTRSSSFAITPRGELRNGLRKSLSLAQYPAQLCLCYPPKPV
jgi:hypothetical protein